jgi:hypothetical protein
MHFGPEGQHDRSLARSAWDSAPRKSRPVGYGVIRARVRADSKIGGGDFKCGVAKQNRMIFGNSCARSYRTLRDGSFERRFPRHFVLGYDHAVPLGQMRSPRRGFH